MHNFVALFARGKCRRDVQSHSAELKSTAESIGPKAVQPVLQTGNLVFGPDDEAKVAAAKAAYSGKIIIVRRIVDPGKAVGERLQRAASPVGSVGCIVDGPVTRGGAPPLAEAEVGASAVASRTVVATSLRADSSSSSSSPLTFRAAYVDDVIDDGWSRAQPRLIGPQPGPASGFPVRKNSV